MPSKIQTPNLNRNPEIAPGVRRFGAHDQYVRKGVWAIKNRNKSSPKKAEKKLKTKKFGQKKPEERTIRPKLNVWFPADPIIRPRNKKSLSVTTRKATLRSTITPGTVLILLAGRFRARRVVFLKQLKSGLLMVTGPYAVNGVPLRRVNQRYVIATSTKVDISGLKLDDKFDDNYFRKQKQEKQKKTEETFFAKGTKRQYNKPAPERVADQKSVDTSLVEAIKKVEDLNSYLGSHFTLRNNQYPHDMKF